MSQRTSFLVHIPCNLNGDLASRTSSVMLSSTPWDQSLREKLLKRKMTFLKSFNYMIDKVFIITYGQTFINPLPPITLFPLTGTSLLNPLTRLPLTGHPLTRLLVNRTPRCPDIEFCVLHSRKPDTR